jgi:amino acid efflux transporter
VSAPPLRRGALAVASSVLGAGALFLPTLAAGQAGSAAVFAWAWQCALGVPLVATIGALARATGEVGVAGFAAAALGPRWRRAVTACYLVGFLAGQAVIAGVAGMYLAGATGGGRAAAYGLGALALAAAAVLAVVGAVPQGRTRGLISVAVAALLAALLVRAVVAGISPARVTDAHLRDVGRTTFLLFFAFVGWERAARSRVPVVRSVVVVALAYAGAAAVALATVESHVTLVPFLAGDAAGGAGLVTAGCCVAIAIGLCSANLRAIAGLWRELRLTSSDVTAARVSGAAAVVVAALLAVEYAVGLGAMLRVPSAMALFVYALAGGAGMVLLRGRRRALAALGLAGTAAIVPFTGWALLAPAAVCAAGLALGAPRSLGREVRPHLLRPEGEKRLDVGRRHERIRDDAAALERDRRHDSVGLLGNEERPLEDRRPA